MKKILFIFILFCSFELIAASNNERAVCSGWPTWFRPVCQRVHQILNEGDNDLYFSGYAWHNRYTYPESKIASYNETAWGGGVGKGFYDEDNDWHALVALGFLDSHKNFQPAAGYVFLKSLRFNQEMHLGIGYAILMTMRKDIMHYIPFPGALPFVNLNYKKVALFMTYIPGSGRTGNVLYLFAKWTLPLSL